MKHAVLAIFLLLLVLIGCNDENNPTNDLEDLPLDTGGVQLALYLGSSASPFGYYAYLTFSL